MTHAAVPLRDSRRPRSETYRATAEGEVARDYPSTMRIESGRRAVLANARQHGFDAAVAGKVKDPTYPPYGVPKWCHAAWLAGYETGDIGAAMSPQSGIAQADTGPET